MVKLIIIGINKESLLGYIKVNVKRKEISVMVLFMLIYLWNILNLCDCIFIYYNNYFFKYVIICMINNWMCNNVFIIVFYIWFIYSCEYFI